MISYGLPCVANVRRNILSISEGDGNKTICASVYFLWASTITRIHWTLIRPALSIYTRNRCLPIHSRGCYALSGGIFALSCHMPQQHSISASSSGHQMRQRERDFILKIPVISMRNSFTEVSRHFVWINTHKILPSCSNNSSFPVVYG